MPAKVFDDLFRHKEYRLTTEDLLANEFVLLKDQAENYIVPSLRLKKTALFRTLENGLNQMRLSTDSVHRALMEYTQAFQRICDLDVLGGYIDGADIQNLPVKVQGDAVVRLRDIAEVRSTFKDPEGFARVNGERALAIEDAFDRMRSEVKNAPLQA